MEEPKHLISFKDAVKKFKSKEELYFTLSYRGKIAWRRGEGLSALLGYPILSGALCFLHLFIYLHIYFLYSPNAPAAGGEVQLGIHGSVTPRREEGAVPS